MRFQIDKNSQVQAKEDSKVFDKDSDISTNQQVSDMSTSQKVSDMSTSIAQDKVAPQQSKTDNGKEVKVNLGFGKKKSTQKSTNSKKPLEILVEKEVKVNLNFSKKSENSEDSRTNSHKEAPKIFSIELPEFLQIFADTEFKQSVKNGMDNLAVSFFSPQLDTVSSVDKSEFTEKFDLISKVLNQNGFESKYYPRQEIEEKLTKVFKSSGLKSLSKTNVKKFFNLEKVQKVFKQYNIDSSQISLNLNKAKQVSIAFRKIKCELQFFFAYADLFRIFGNDVQVIWYENAKLTQFRTIKIMGRVKVTKIINGIPTDIIIDIFDNRYCLPPIKGSLGDQAVTFGAIDYLEKLQKETKSERVKYLLNLTLDKNKLIDSIEKVVGEKVTLDWIEENYEFLRNALKYERAWNEYQKDSNELNTLSEKLEDKNLKLSESWVRKNIKLVENGKKWAEAYSKYTGKCSKLKISERIKEVHGDELTEDFCKQNMDIIREKYPKIFFEYAEIDVLITWALNQALNGLLDKVCKLLGIETPKLAETCGKNIENILLKLIQKHFDITDDDEVFKTDDLKNLIKLGGAKNLSKNSQNDYGVVPLSVVGGLLFTRTALQSVIEGNFFDLDLKSCYATGLTSMNLYLGQPICLSFGESNKEKPKVRDVWNKLKNLKVPKDGWFLRASGKLNKAQNTLILSDDGFENGKNIKTDKKRYEFPEDNDLESELLNLINGEKVSEKVALSKVLYKEINHGVITEATLTALSDLPQDWFDEFLDLEVDFLCYYHPELACNSLEELFEKQKDLGDYNKFEYLTDDLQKDTKGCSSKNNCYLVFPLGEKYKNIKNLRGQMKKAGEPVQEIFKLILNSTYGILASLVMLVNNPIAANWITSCARAAAWRMTNALNGCNPITDGTAINGNTIPFEMNFHEVLNKYPNYLIKYESSIENNTKLIFESEDGFSDDYIKHLEKFIGKSDWLTQMYAYDLKDEKDDNKNKHYHYQKHHNTNAGNYIKNGEGFNTFKARSYRKTDKLVEWYQKATEGNYNNHLIYADRTIIKLSQGSIDSIRILKDAEDVVNREKKVLRMPIKIASKIVSDGLCHPMGFAKEEVKVMKLISPSQFLCQDTRQFKLLNSFYEVCKSISKDILPNKEWNGKNFGLEKLKSYKIIHSDGSESKIEIRDDIDYAAWNKFNPVGLGFELLIWANSNLNCLNDVRNRIQELIWEYDENDEKWNLKGLLNWNRSVENLKNNVELKHFLAAVQIAKLNFELDYRETLANSVHSPLARIEYLGDVGTLREEKTKFE